MYGFSSFQTRHCRLCPTAINSKAKYCPGCLAHMKQPQKEERYGLPQRLREELAHLLATTQKEEAWDEADDR